jgi:hypothetical protein
MRQVSFWNIRVYLNHGADLFFIQHTTLFIRILLTQLESASDKSIVYKANI